MNDAANTQDRVPDLLREASALLSVVDEWAKLDEISTEDQAQQLRDLLAKISGRIKQVDETRMAEKRPYLDAEKAVDGRYSPIIATLTACLVPVRAMLNSWLGRERDRQREEAAAARKEAARLADEAKAARKAVESERTVGATLAAVDAEKRAAEAAKLMEEAVRARPQVESASGGARRATLRTTWYAVCTSAPLACRRYGDHPDVIAVFEKLASAEAREAKGNISMPGFDVRSRENVA